MVRELIRYDTSVMMHKIKYGSSPSYPQEIFHTIDEVHEKPLRNSENVDRCLSKKFFLRWSSCLERAY